MICDNALVSGFALDQRLITRDLVLEVCADFDFVESTGEAEAASAFAIPEPIEAPPSFANPASPADADTATPDPAADAQTGLSAQLAKLRQLAGI